MKKIICIIICMLLIATTFSVAESLKNNKINATFSSLSLNKSIEDWTEIQKLLASDGTIQDMFGNSVSIDGDTALIGAPGKEDNEGAAYIFKWNGDNWIQQQKLTSSKDDIGNVFGYCVSLDGNFAFISAYGNESVYVFKYNGFSWTQQQRLVASDGESGDWFGISVSLCGNYAIIGSQLDEDGTGSAYIFKWNGYNWIQQQKLMASDGQPYDQFGYSVSINGNFAFVGAPHINSVYVFKLVGTTWIQEAKIVNPDTGEDDDFGCSVFIGEQYGAIGAYGDDGNKGSVYVFSLDPILSDWQKLTASDGEIDDYFGCSLSLNGDYIIIGAFGNDDDGEYSGSAYIFKNDGTNWFEEKKLIASDGDIGGMFGYSVSINGGKALIGAMGDDYGKGSAYVFLGSIPQNPPSPPEIYGATNGKPDTAYPYTFISTDPDGDYVSYYIEWGDGENTSWTEFRPSGSPGYIESHSWDTKGEYVIQAQAKDVYGHMSDWSKFVVKIPRTYTPLILKYLERFLNTFPLLSHLFRL